MKLFNFSGQTPAHALRKAQEKYGKNIYLVSTKEIQKKTINQDSLYEIIIGIDDESGNERDFIKPANTNINKRPNIKPKNPYLQNEDVVMDISETTKKISEAAKQISQIAGVSSPRINDTQMQTVKENRPKGASLQEINDIKSEIAKLTNKIQLIQEMFWDEKSPNDSKFVIPPEFAQIYKLAYKSGMSSEHLNTIMGMTLENMPNQMKSSIITVKRYFQVLLRKLIPTRMELTVARGNQKIMMLVGPTGVGKTTTLAKLAARYAVLGEKRYRVGIVTLDSYRLGASEQLSQYAKMMKLPFQDVSDIDDFEPILHSMRGCDIVLIDTVGSSQHDKEKLQKIDEFVKKSYQKIDINLVLSAGTKLEDLKEIYQEYSFLNIDTLLVTKFDETKTFGNIFSLIYDCNKPVSYFSTGQEVPDDLRLATSEYLVECMLDGFRKANDVKSSK